MSTYKFGRINLNIQIEIGLYDENVSHVCSARFFPLLVAFISSSRIFILKTTKNPTPKPYPSMADFFSDKQNRKQNQKWNRTRLIRQINYLLALYGWLHSVSQAFDSTSEKEKRKYKMSTCNNARRRVFGNCCQCVTNKMFTFDYLIRLQFPFSHRMLRYLFCFKINFNVLSVVWFQYLFLRSPEAISNIAYSYSV